MLLERDDLRALVRRQLGAAARAQRLLGDPRLGHDHRRHALVADVVGEPHHGDVHDARHAADHLLDLERREAQPGAPDDVAMAAHEVQEAVGVALDDVAGPEHAVAQERRRPVGVAEVAERHVVSRPSRHHELALHPAAVGRPFSAHLDAVAGDGAPSPRAAGRPPAGS